MARSILLATQIGQDFIHTPASQNVWLAGMAEGFGELGFRVHIPWRVKGPEADQEGELARVKQRFAELYGVGGARLEFVDARELDGPRLPRRFDILWARDPELLSKSSHRGQYKVGEFHGGVREKSLPDLASNSGFPLVTVTENWAKRFGASAIAEPGALRVFYQPSRGKHSSSESKLTGVYAGGLDPDRIDGQGVSALRQLLGSGARLQMMGGNLGVEVDHLQWRLGKRGRGTRFYGYVAPAVSAKIMHLSDFSVALKAERSAPSAPIKLIAFAAAKLPIVASPTFLQPDFSGAVARTLRINFFSTGANPRAGAALQSAMANSHSDTAHNYQVALDNTFARRIEKTGLIEHFN